MKKIEAVLSDMDGTLIETDEANATAYCNALRKFGFKYSVDDFITTFRGKSWRVFLPQITSLSLEECKDIAVEKRNTYKNHLYLTKLNHHVLQMLISAKKDTLIGLVTTASKGAVEDLLSFHKLKDFFDVIITGDDVSIGKPDPEPYFVAAKKLGVDIKNCTIFEDSEIGLQSARASGAFVFLVATNATIGG